MSKNRVTDVAKNFLHNQLPRERKRQPRTNKRFLIKDDVERIVIFIQNFAAEHAHMLPGRHPGRKDYTAKLYLVERVR